MKRFKVKLRVIDGNKPDGVRSVPVIKVLTQVHPFWSCKESEINSEMKIDIEIKVLYRFWVEKPCSRGCTSVICPQVRQVRKGNFISYPDGLNDPPSCGAKFGL